MEQKYSHLLRPLDLGFITLRNRAVMGAMHCGLEKSKKEFQKLAVYFARRAEGEVGLIVTGGISPNLSGRLSPFSSQLSFSWQTKKHKIVTNAVHKAGGKIVMQILHAGRYGYHPFVVSASKLKSPISPFQPRKLTEKGIQKTISQFTKCARLAQNSGYDGIEIMGSEGYLIHQFIALRTNKRKDTWGGSYQNRTRFPVELVKKIREKVGKNFLLIFRLSMLDLVENGSTLDEIISLGKELEKAGVNIINTGIGWHEARIPTIASLVPRAAFTWVSHMVKKELSLPIITSNRINTPAVAEQVLKNGEADMISMARPFLADPDFIKKARENRADEINVCIACNQGCLDNIFEGKNATCLVNPKACRETVFLAEKSNNPKNIAVIGAGPAGLAFSLEAKNRGHNITLYEKQNCIGGQLNLASKIPGKYEFEEMLHYFEKQLQLQNIQVILSTCPKKQDLELFDEIVLATGVTPRKLSIEGITHQKVLSYLDVLSGKEVGKRVAIIGAGGIGFDIAKYLLYKKEDMKEKQYFFDMWGIDNSYKNRGALLPKTEIKSEKTLFLLQRKHSKMGKSLGKTTGWIERLLLKKKI